jgi:starch synthase
LESKAEKIPFICATSRLVEQKGYDTAAAAIVNLISRHLDKKIEQPICVLGGAGDPEQYRILQNLKNELQKISPEAARRVFVFRGYRDEFAYALQLAADFYLMPSRFEPCGLTQMEAMAKGCLPIAMSTGGLVDTITDGQDGFRTDVFFADGHRVYGSNAKAQKLKNNVNAYAEALSKALRCFYLTPNTLHLMTVNAMKQDFSWSVDNGSVYKYYNLFKNGTP